MNRLNGESAFYTLNFASIPQKPTNGLCMKYIILLGEITNQIALTTETSEVSLINLLNL